jgi:hypothetical protein
MLSEVRGGFGVARWEGVARNFSYAFTTAFIT